MAMNQIPATAGTDDETEDQQIHWSKDPERQMTHNLSGSLDAVLQILDKTVLQKCADVLYNKYLQPKILPYTALQTIELTQCQVHVSLLAL